MSTVHALMGRPRRLLTLEAAVLRCRAVDEGGLWWKGRPPPARYFSLRITSSCGSCIE